MRRRDKWLIAVVLVIVALVAVRVAMPTMIRDFVNNKLQALEEYDGHVADVDLSILRGAYRVDNIEIVKTGGKQPVPFFSADHIDLSVEWRNLLRGSLVGQAMFHSPNINFIQGKTKEQSQTGEGVDWGKRIAEVFPFRINTVTVHNGTISFLAPGINTADAIKATNVEARVANITNVVNKDKETFADFRVTAAVLDGGSAEISGAVDPLDSNPTFDVNLQLRQVKLQQINPWLREYIKADAEGGDFELYMEIAAADGKFQGYAKPVLQNVNIYSSEEPEKNPLKRLWEGVVDFAANVLENEEKEQVAARIPFTGTIDNPQTSVMATIVSVLRNAFVSAFARSLEGSISVRNVRENLKGLGEPAADEKEKAARNDKDQKRGKDKDEGDDERSDRKEAASSFGPKSN